MRSLALICLLLVVTPIIAETTNNFSVGALLAYNKWRFTHKRTYFSAEEQQFRQNIFFENHKRIEEHNANPNATYKMTHNQFSDMAKEEYKNRILMRGHPGMMTKGVPRVENPKPMQDEQPVEQLPLSMDWRDYGIMTEVKNQGQCGSCWAFSITGTLEPFHYIKLGEKINLSEQQMVDCVGAKGYEAYGCSGGWPMEAMKYVAEYGLLKQEQYPYVGVDSKCQVETPTEDGFKVSSFFFLDQTAEALKDAVARLPVSVLVDASLWGNYASGVFNDCVNTQENELNHAVVAIGYDEEGNWLIRNSWGTEWGMEGHMKLAPGNTCGILYSNVIATY